MRVAIVHDWLVCDAGAEKVLEAILSLYPDATIYTLVDFLTPHQRDRVLHGKTTITSFIQKLPLAKKHFRNYLPLFTRAIESFDVSQFDLVISSSWAVAKGVKTNSTQTHVCYCHTPVRYAWDLYEEYTSNLTGIKKLVVKMSLKRLRAWDRSTASRVDHFVANSKFVAGRIERTYGTSSTVIYPPVDTDQFSLCAKKNNFYLTASRLVPYKKTALIVEAFTKMPHRKLVVIGSGEELGYIREIATPNIEILGYCTDETLVDHMQRACAFVYAAVEDFGIVPIEALACGTPVIGLDDGGTAETIIDKKNGIHFKRQSVEEIMRAVSRFELNEFDLEQISKDALLYSKQRFLKQFKDFIDSVL